MSLTDSNGNRTWAKFPNESETLPLGQGICVMVMFSNFNGRFGWGTVSCQTNIFVHNFALMGK